MHAFARTTLSAAALLAACVAAHAQTIDQFNVRREGDDAVLQLRFASEIQFNRALSSRSGDQTLIFYSLITTTNAQLRASQAMTLGAAQGVPRLTLTDESDRDERSRKIVLRTAASTRLDVRAGEGNRSIEIVFIGAGVAAPPAAPPRRATTTGPAPVAAPAEVTPATLPTADRRFVIVLQSSTDPNATLAAVVPRGLQNYDVFTSERVVDGVRRYEVLLGHFTNRTQADAVLRQLGAFPQAAIMASAAVGQPAGTAVAAAPSEAPTPVPAPPPANIDVQSDALFATARAALAQQNFVAATAALNELLNLPPNLNTREAQELAGVARARSGDTARARIEFETYLQLYPQGEGSDRVRRELAALPAPTAATSAQAQARPGVEVTTTGSASMSYFGGNGQIRSQDFKDSPIAGIPQVAGDPLFSADKSRQLFNDVDLNWRRRDADSDLRFVFRDAYTTDLERSDKSKNRLSALYIDYKSLTGGYGVRLGRQSPTGGGVMGRFDGISGNVLLRPKLKLSAVAGEPTDKFFESRRRFYGASLDADGLLPNFGAAVYMIQQTIDGEIDRRAIGLDMRYFKSGASMFSQFDYDTLIKGLNIATVQGSLVMDDGTVFNALYDRRALSMLALGNSLTFGNLDPVTGQPLTRIADRLAGPPPLTLAELRDQIKRTTPFITQAQLGITRSLDKTWQIGASAQLTDIGAIPPVPGVVGFEQGRPPSKSYSASAQLIGLNLYSSRDTHVLSGTAIHSTSYKDVPLMGGLQMTSLTGWLLSYNNSSLVAEVWQIEPSVQYYRDRSSDSLTSERWTPGLRVTYRGWNRWSLESSLTYELGRASRVTVDPTDPTLTITTKESSTRANYSLGARYAF